MSVVGYQDFWVVGARAKFQKDPVDDVVQPLVDLGLIRSVRPTITPTEVELFDPAGGILNKVDSALTKIDEQYEFTCANFNERNLSFLYLSNDPEAFTQTASGTSAITSWIGQLVKVVDSDADATPLYNLSKVVGVWETAGATTLTTLTSITPGTKTFSFSANPSLIANDYFVVTTAGSVSAANAGTYKVASISGAGPYLVVSVETPGGSTQSTLTGTAVIKGNSAILLQKDGVLGAEIVGWEATAGMLVRGEIRILDTDATQAIFSGTHMTLNVAWATTALSGNRLITPQSLKGQIEGTMFLYLGRENDARQHVREMRVGMVPTGQSLVADNFSDFTMRASVLANVTDNSAGRMISIAGDLPDAS